MERESRANKDNYHKYEQKIKEYYGIDTRTETFSGIMQKVGISDRLYSNLHDYFTQRRNQESNLLGMRFNGEEGQTRDNSQRAIDGNTSSDIENNQGKIKQFRSKDGEVYGFVHDGRTYRVKTTMQEFRGSEENKPHSYEVTKIELLDSPEKREYPDRSHSDASNNSISTAKLLNGVEKSYDKGKKLLDESKDLAEGETHFPFYDRYMTDIVNISYLSVV